METNKPIVKIDAKMVKSLRDATGLGMMDCKTALKATNGDVEAAKGWLRTNMVQKVEKRTERPTKAGMIHSYIHPGNEIGVLLELNCESSFVAKTEEFKELAKKLAMHVAAANPLWLKPDDIPWEIVEAEKSIYHNQLVGTKKPEKIWDKIINGKLGKFKKETCLTEQIFVMDTKKTVSSLIDEMTAKTGEKVSIGRFTRYMLGG